MNEAHYETESDDQQRFYDIEDWQIRHQKAVAKIRVTSQGTITTDERGVAIQVERIRKRPDFVQDGETIRAFGPPPTREGILEKVPGFLCRNTYPLPGEEAVHGDDLATIAGAGEQESQVIPGLGEEITQADSTVVPGDGAPSAGDLSDEEPLPGNTAGGPAPDSMLGGPGVAE